MLLQPEDPQGTASSCKGDMALGSVSAGILNAWAVGKRVPYHLVAWLGKLCATQSLASVLGACGFPVPRAWGVASVGTFSAPGRLGSMCGGAWMNQRSFSLGPWRCWLHPQDGGLGARGPWLHPRGGGTGIKSPCLI